MKKIAFVAVLFAMSSVAGYGQLGGIPENWCRNGLFPRESTDAFIATVKARRGARVYFYGDDGNCPNAKGCRKRSYLVANDEVIVSKEFGKWVCVWYQPEEGGETVGWIAKSDLEHLTLLMEGGPRVWVGVWKAHDNTIEIKEAATQNVYDIKGTAFWKGLGDNIHIGELDGPAKFDDGKLLYGFDDEGEYACRVTLDRVGGFMLVSDNLNCGGANVTFSGVYQRK